MATLEPDNLKLAFCPYVEMQARSCKQHVTRVLGAPLFQGDENFSIKTEILPTPSEHLSAW